MRAKVLPAIPPQEAQFRSDGTYIQWRVGNGGTWENLVALADLEVPADGDYGDIVVAAGGATWTIDPSVISDFGRTLTDDVDADTALSTLGFSAFIKTLVGAADAAAALTVLGVTAFMQTVLAAASAAAAWLVLQVLGHVTSRTLLKALVPSVGMAVYLSEAGREGTFVWRTGDYSTLIAADTAGGLYLKADTIAASSGAWVRAYSGPANVRWFGVTGDGSTDDYAAFQIAANVGRSLYVPGGYEYKLSDGVQLSSNTKIVGDGIGSKLTSTGTNKRVLWANGKSNIEISDLYINGNLTGAGSTGSTSAGGDGIAFINCTYCKVVDCTFANIGGTTGTPYASCVWGYQLVSSSIRNNVFLASNGGGVANNGADVNCSYYCNRLEISGNYSVSEQDSSIYVGAVGASQGDNDRNIITDNYAERANGSVTRSGILVPYNAKSAYTVIANNVMVNFPANGIYVSAGAAASADAGGVTITGNILMWCGGASYMTGISAGLYLSGYNGLTAVGNLIYKTGYERGGSKRTNDVPGIRVTNTSRRISCSSNVVRDSSAQGLLISDQSNDAMSALSFANNQFLNNVLGGILVSVANAGSTIDGLSIVGGIIDQESNDYDGITFTQSSSGPTPTDVTISGVQVLGVSSSTKYGITTNMAGFLGWNIEGNTLKNWTRGISFASGSVTDKDVGKGAALSENYFDTCTTGIFANISTGKFALHFGSTFRNCTNESNDLGRIVAASRLGGGTFEIRKAAAPGDGAWLVGDRLNYTAPASGGFIGEVCTTAGSPGTWKTYGAIS